MVFFFKYWRNLGQIFLNDKMDVLISVHYWQGKMVEEDLRFYYLAKYWQHLFYWAIVKNQDVANCFLNHIVVKLQDFWLGKEIGNHYVFIFLPPPCFGDGSPRPGGLHLVLLSRPSSWQQCFSSLGRVRVVLPTVHNKEIHSFSSR